MPDADNPQAFPVPYKRTSDPRYLAALRESIRTSVNDAGADVIEWMCPRCDFQQHSEWARDQPSPMLSRTRSRPDEPESVSFALECDCGEDHAGREAADRGCGYGAKVSFYL